MQNLKGISGILTRYSIYRLTDKRYARDNRLIIFKSSYWWDCLAPRCRLIATWWCTRCQGFGCSPIKAVRELGLERCETVWILSTVTILKKNYSITLVRKDWELKTNGLGVNGMRSYAKFLPKKVYLINKL